MILSGIMYIAPFFFATGTSIDTLFYEFEQLNDAMAAHWKAGSINGKQPSVTRRTILHFEIDGTPVSIGRVSEMHGSAEDTEILTGIKLSHNKDILTKKLFNRLFENQVVTERDAYDFGVARTLDPQSLEYAWSHIGEHARQGVISSLEALASKAVELDEAKRVQNAEYPSFLSNVWKEVLAMFVSNLQHQPPLSADTDS